MTIQPPSLPVQVGEVTTVWAIVTNHRGDKLNLRWSWDDGSRTSHADAKASPATDRQVVVWQGSFAVPGVHRIDLLGRSDDEPRAAAFVVAVPPEEHRLIISGQVIEEAVGRARRAVPIGLLVPTEDSRGLAAELRWQDEGIDVRSREVSWVLDRPDGWVHLGGTASGAFGTVNPFRAHFRLSDAIPARALQGEIRLYPPGANPGVDPPQRVIAGPIQALRRRGSTRA